MASQEDILKKVKSVLDGMTEEKRKDKERLEEDRKNLVMGIGQELVKIVQPLLDKLTKQSNVNTQEIGDAISKIKIDVPLQEIPPVEIPTINVPRPEVNVNIPDVIVPEIKMPDEMSINGWVQLQGVDLSHPLPVQLRDHNGKPVDMFKNLTSIVSQGGGGGGPRFITVKDIQSSTGTSIIDNDGFLKVTGSFASDIDFGSGEIGSLTTRTVQATDAISSVNVVDAFGSTSASGVFNADNRIRVSVETGGSGLTDSELRAESVPVSQASGANWSVNVAGFSASVASIPTNAEGINYDSDNPQPVDVASTVGLTDTELRASAIDVDGSGVTQPVSGTFFQATQPVSAAALPLPSGAATSANQLADGHNVTVDNASGASAVNIQDGGNTITVDGTVVVSGITNSVASSIIDSSGVQYSGSNPVPVDGSSVTQPISASALPLPSGAATSANQQSDALTDTELRDSSVPTEQVSGSSWSVFVTGSNGTVGVVTIDPDGNPTYASATSGLTDTELRAASVPVEQVSGSIWSTYVTGIFNSTTADVINPDNRIKVELPTGASGLTDTELRASSVPVAQASGAIWSTNMATALDHTIDSISTQQVSGATDSVNVVSTVGLTDTELRASSVPVAQASGANWSTEVSNTVTVDGSGVTQPVSGTVAVSGITDSTTAIIGDKRADEADGDSNPVKIGGVARTGNTSAVANGDRVSASFDTRGRQIVLPYNVRDLRATAYASLSTGTEATLLSASAGEFHDLVWLMGANQSDVAVTVDFRMVTAGNIVMSLEIPANGTAGIAPAVPYPQSDTGNNWTADMSDITGTTVDITALFSKEV